MSREGMRMTTSARGGADSASPGATERAVTRMIATWLAETPLDALPAPVMRETARVLLDSIGCAVAGHVTDKGRIAAATIQGLGGSPQSTILGTGVRTSSPNAA